jgi:drug/metabolite transporter (DMT)-like permease
MKLNKTRLSEWLLGLAIIIALILVLNPSGIIMTSTYTLTILMILGVAVIAFGAFVWRERYRDEREELHAMKAGRLSYFAGGAVLVTAIIAQTLAHSLDVWLVAALVAMVVTKIAVSAWNVNR